MRSGCGSNYGQPARLAGRIFPDQDSATERVQDYPGGDRLPVVLLGVTVTCDRCEKFDRVSIGRNADLEPAFMRGMEADL